MKCGQCPMGKRYAKGSTFCKVYGMIVRDNHEGTMKGCLETEGQRRDEEQTETVDIYGLEEWPED